MNALLCALEEVDKPLFEYPLKIQEKGMIITLRSNINTLQYDTI
jgi:hypothetical protein